jgi:hypothetical protein
MTAYGTPIEEEHLRRIARRTEFIYVANPEGELGFSL